MRALARITTYVVLAGAAVMIAFQLLDAPAKYVIVSGHSMEPKLHTGDLAFMIRHASYRPGDVVAYRVPDGEPGAGGIVIHRVIGGSNAAGYLTKGDNRAERDSWRPKPDDMLGTMAFRIPRAGLVSAFFGTPLGLGLAAGLLAFFLLARGGGTRPKRQLPAPREPAAWPAPAFSPSVAGVGSASGRTGPTPLVLATAALAVGGLVLLAARASRS